VDAAAHLAVACYLFYAADGRYYIGRGTDPAADLAKQNAKARQQLGSSALPFLIAAVIHGDSPFLSWARPGLPKCVAP
jgi:hypothetical protein